MSYQDIENALLNHPDVVEVCVISAPHPEHEKTTKAFVALRKGASASNETLHAFLKSQLNGRSEGIQVQVLEELPKGPTGAVSRRMLIAMC
jgi:long-chain acyl-CoA synthetase